MAPFIKGQWPKPDSLSSAENNGIFIDVHTNRATVGYGVNFYRLLLAAGVPARCRQVMGAMHAVETFTTVCPEISRDTARDLAAFCKGG